MRSRREHFRIHKVRRIYDRSANKFAFNISYEIAVQLTPRTILVAEAGLGVDKAQKFKVLDTELKIAPTDVFTSLVTAVAARAFCCGRLRIRAMKLST